MRRKVWASFISGAAALALLAVPGIATAGPGGAKKVDDARGDWRNGPGSVAVVRYGPFTVPAAVPGEHPGMIMNRLVNIEPPCTNCYITDIVPNLVYADGTSANFNNGAMLHHYVLFNPERRDATCPNGLFGFNLGERVFASGNERTHNHLPKGYGYPTTSDNWRLITDLMNMHPEPRTMFIETTYRYRPMSKRLKPVTPLWFDVDNCRDSQYSIATGYSDTHWDWTSDREGYVIGIGGHVHDIDHEMPGCHMAHCAEVGGGIAVSAEIVGGQSGDYFGPSPNPLHAGLNGATLCRSQAYYGTEFGHMNGYHGHLDTMSACGIGKLRKSQSEAYPPGGAFPKRGYPLSAGQTIRLHSEYQNNGEPRNDVMGIMVGWLHETAVR